MMLSVFILPLPFLRSRVCARSGMVMLSLSSVQRTFDFRLFETHLPPLMLRGRFPLKVVRPDLNSCDRCP